MLVASILAFALVAQALPAPGGVTLSHQAKREEDPNEKQLKGQFGALVALEGGNIKQDTTFPPGANGELEIEFSDGNGRHLTVTENKTPTGAPPVGFVPLEPSSYTVTLSGGPSKGLTVSKVDYIQSPGSKLDISTGQIGRLCTETNTFVIGANVGELEFEADEKELSLKVADMNAEWGIFIPQAAAGGAAAASNTTTSATGGAVPATGSSNGLVALLMSLLGINK